MTRGRWSCADCADVARLDREWLAGNVPSPREVALPMARGAETDAAFAARALRHAPSWRVPWPQ